MNGASWDRKATEVTRVKLAQQDPLAYLEQPPCSHHTRECQENRGQEERRATPACPANRDLRAVLENWGLRDPPDRRVPRDRKAHAGPLEQPEAPALLVPAAPLEARVPLAAEAPLGKRGSAVRREQQARKGALEQLAPGEILAPLGSPGRPERAKMERRVLEGHLDHLGLQEPRESEVHLGSLALLAAVATRALGSPAPLALQDLQETKGPRDLEAHLESPAPRDQLARMAYQETQEKEGLLANRASLHCCLQGT